VFGPSKVGKTRLVSTANTDTRTAPLLLIDLEHGDRSLRGLGVDLVRVKDWDDFNEVYAYLAKGDHPYRSIALDSASEINWMSILSVLDMKAATGSSGKVKDNNKAERDDYGRSRIQMRRLVRYLIDLGLHTFIIAGSSDVLDPRIGMLKKPALNGQLANDIPAMMDIIAYLDMVGVEDKQFKRTLVLKNYANVATGVRLPWDYPGPDEIVDPTITKLLDACGYSAYDERKENGADNDRLLTLGANTTKGGLPVRSDSGDRSAKGRS